MAKFRNLTKISLSLLAAGALLSPVLTLPAPAAPAVTMDQTMAQDAQKEAGPLRKMLDNLNLTDAQRASIKKIYNDAQPTFAQLRQNEMANKEQLRAVSLSKYDAGKVQDLANKQGQDVSKRIVAREKLRADIYNVLTPEQKKQVDDAMAQRAAQKAAKQAAKNAE
jgi:periplasmic protein CpxP/Spy